MENYTGREAMGLKVEISRRAREMIERIGINSECVTQAVDRPDDVHKIRPSSDDRRDWPVISLYLKRFQNGADETAVLIQALKHGGIITVTAVWKVYLEDIGVSASSGALETFKAFIEKYGVGLRTACGLTKLVTYHVVPSTTTVSGDGWKREFVLPEGVFDAEDRRVTQTPELSLNKWARELNVKMHIALLYTVNLSNYLHDLAAHRTACIGRFSKGPEIYRQT